jgi:hypothetical protein
VADKLNLRWRVLGACGVFCLVASTLALIGLTNPNLFFSTSRGQRSAGDSLAPQWFDNRCAQKKELKYTNASIRSRRPLFFTSHTSSPVPSFFMS